MNSPLTPSFPLRVAICAAAAFAASAMFAEDASAHPTARADAVATDTTVDHARPLKHTDRAFIEKAVESGREEVAISRIAAERATNPDVKKFAQMMVDDHSRANDELAALAAKKDVKLKDRTKNEDKWSKKDPNAFDHDYVKEMLSDHKQDIKLFSKESKDGSDAELIEFARKTLPTLNHHLEAVNTLEQTVR